MKKTIFLSLFVALLSAVSFAQVSMLPITLSAAITSSSAQTVVVSAATGLNSNSYAIAAGTSYLYVDGEYMAVNAVNGTTLSVTRGYGGTRASTHASGAYVFVGPSTFFFNGRPGLLTRGSCARSNFVNLPRIDISSQTIYDCLGGVVVQGLSGQNVMSGIGQRFPDPGGTALTALETNGTAAAASTHTYCTEIDLPLSKYATGLGLLNGTTATTDKHLVILYDASGNLIANSAVAGATASGASAYQAFAFTSPAYLVGPARYFGCFQANGTTATVRHAITGTNDNVYTSDITGTVFGTIPATITAPSSFTTAVGAYMSVY